MRGVVNTKSTATYDLAECCTLARRDKRSKTCGAVVDSLMSFLTGPYKVSATIYYMATKLLNNELKAAKYLDFNKKRMVKVEYLLLSIHIDMVVLENRVSSILARKCVFCSLFFIIAHHH